MTDNKTKVTIRAKQLASLLDDDRAQQMYARKGGRWVAIIELKHAERHEAVDGDKRADLVIDQLELVDDGILEGRAVDHVRTIMAALNRNRQLAENGPQLPLEDDGVPTIEGAVDQGAALIDHDDEGPKVWDGETLPTDEPPSPDEPGESWEYDQPEGTREPAAVGSPFEQGSS